MQEDQYNILQKVAVSGLNAKQKKSQKRLKKYINPFRRPDQRELLPTVYHIFCCQTQPSSLSEPQVSRGSSQIFFEYQNTIMLKRLGLGKKMLAEKRSARGHQKKASGILRDLENLQKMNQLMVIQQEMWLVSYQQAYWTCYQQLEIYKLNCVFMLDLITDKLKSYQGLNSEKRDLCMCLIGISSFYLLKNICYTRFYWYEAKWQSKKAYAILLYLLFTKYLKPQEISQGSNADHDKQNYQKIEETPDINNIMTSDIDQQMYLYRTFIQSTKNEKLVGPGGANLSGGQRQRVAICRALYLNSDIYLLDDIFSSLYAHVTQKVFQSVVFQEHQNPDQINYEHELITKQDSQESILKDYNEKEKILDDGKNQELLVDYDQNENQEERKTGNVKPKTFKAYFSIRAILLIILVILNYVMSGALMLIGF
ncbi:hypothetical protein ABPG72_002657 [Tetrahymena utriculariae]